MKVIVIGLGSIGKRHVKNLNRLYPDWRIAVLRQHSKETDVGDLRDCIEEVFLSEKDALSWGADVAFITNPAPFHIETAIVFAKSGCHLFMEKPLSDSLAGIDDLIMECKRRKLVLMVGYCMRFLKPLRIVKDALGQDKIGRILLIRAAVGSFLPKWRPQSDYRENVSARKELGGGVLLELSHELDLLRWLAGEIVEVSALVDKVSDLAIDVDDVAEINLRFANHAVGHVHLDFLDHTYTRFCHIVGEKGSLIWDCAGKGSVRLIEQDEGEKYLYQGQEEDRTRMYDDEILHFFDCVKHGKEALINVNDGKRIVEVVLAARRSAEEGVIVKL